MITRRALSLVAVLAAGIVSGGAGVVGPIGTSGTGLYPAGPDLGLTGSNYGVAGSGGGGSACAGAPDGQLDFSNPCDVVYIPAIGL